MSEMAALRAALDLFHVPTRLRYISSKPLPGGLLILLRVAVRERDALQLAEALSGRPSSIIQNAAEFFIEQVLLRPESNSYQVLGASPAASSNELRRNMILLLKWLHPDHLGPEGRSIFARRVIRAWDNLKTPERRAAYDSALRSPRVKNTAKSTKAYAAKRTAKSQFGRASANEIARRPRSAKRTRSG